MVAVNIGGRIRALRLENKTTLKDLATRCGVTSSLLSQIEKSKASPSLSTLSKIAFELQTTVGALVDGEHNDKFVESHLVVRAKNRKRLDDSDSHLTLWSLSEQMPFKLMQPMVFTFDGLSEDTGFRYKHFGQEFILILSGKLCVIYGKEEIFLEEGDSLYFDSSIDHVFLNAFNGTTEVISVNSPSNF